VISQLASNEEAIGPGDESRLVDMMKETHRVSSFINRHGASILRPTWRDYGGQVAHSVTQ